MKLLFAMIAGGKCGNIVSPNPNTIIVADNFQVELSSVMFINIMPAIIGLMVAVIIIHYFPDKGEKITNALEMKEDISLPPFWSSVIGPVVTILLLAMRPLFNVSIDPLIALPIGGGLVGIIAMRKTNQLKTSLAYGLEKMSVVAVLLIGTGTIAGIIKNSTLKDSVLSLMDNLSLSDSFIAPVSGVLMSAITASTTAGATLASASFADVILAAGIPAVWGAAMINSGATTLDHLPHGSFFHVTGGSVNMNLKERMSLIFYESLIGFCLTSGTFICHLLM